MHKYFLQNYNFEFGFHLRSKPAWANSLPAQGIISITLRIILILMGLISARKHSVMGQRDEPSLIRLTGSDLLSVPLRDGNLFQVT